MLAEIKKIFIFFKQNPQSHTRTTNEQVIRRIIIIIHVCHLGFCFGKKNYCFRSFGAFFLNCIRIWIKLICFGPFWLLLFYLKRERERNFSFSLFFFSSFRPKQLSMWDLVASSPLKPPVRPSTKSSQRRTGLVNNRVCVYVTIKFKKEKKLEHGSDEATNEDRERGGGGGGQSTMTRWLGYHLDIRVRLL